MSNNISIPIHKILTGKLRTWWTDSSNKKIVVTKRLIKDIRINLMLEWINKRYPEIPIVFLIRNPFAVVESWNRAKWSYLKPKKRILEQKNLLEPLLPKNVFYNYEMASSPLENHFYNWSINYYLPLKTFRNNEIFITYYENYLKDPLDEVKNLFSYLNKSFDGKALDTLKEFSRTTRTDSPLKKSEDILMAWKKKYTEEEMNKCMKILSQFGLDTLYDYYDSGLPSGKLNYIN